MKNKLPNYEQFINEANKRSTLFQDIYEMMKKTHRTGITEVPQYQKFDQDVFFEFKENGITYRVHHDSIKGNVELTNMDDGEITEIVSVQDFMAKIN